MDDLFGWEMVYTVSEADIKKKEDVIALLIHFLLIKNDFKLIGLGESKEFTGSEATSEILPSGWSDSSTYSFRYIGHDGLYLLKSVPAAENLVFNLINVKTLEISSFALNCVKVVKNLNGPLSSLFEGHEGLIAQIKSDLIKSHLKSDAKEATTQTSQTPQPVNPPEHVVRRNPQPARVDPIWNNPDDPFGDPLRVGRRDLDPFAQGGGMIFNPFGNRGIPDPGFGIPGGLPRGAVPPGARFDPFGPPMPQMPRRRPPPDADHFRPPGSGFDFI